MCNRMHFFCILVTPQKSKSKEMLSGLRYFEHTLKDDGRGCAKAAFSWGAVDMASVARCFIDLCLKAIDVFASEPRLLEMASPVYVLGVCVRVLCGCVFCVCMYVCLVDICVCMYICMCVCMCVWWIYVCVCTYVCVYVCVSGGYMCVYVHMYMCMYVCLVDIYVCS